MLQSKGPDKISEISEFQIENHNQSWIGFQLMNLFW
jgi:hypothetical protein